MSRNSNSKRSVFSKAAVSVIAIVLVCAIMIGLVPNDALAAMNDADTSSTYSASLGDNASTEYSGRVWTDKSVYTKDTTFRLYGGKSSTIEKEDDEDFLVAFSALGTSQAISGESVTPIDVVFVFDMSSSMTNNKMDNGQTRLYNATVALNSAVEALLGLNDYVRIGVVAFNSTAYEVLPLEHYEKYDGRDFFTCSGSTVTVNAKGTSTTRNNYRISTESGTNIQKGIFDGMNMLATEDSTSVNINGQEVNRIPSVIMLSDGQPSNASTYTNWWNIASDTEERKPGWTNYTVYGMKAVMTATYMKAAIDRNYEGVDTTVYSIGMGITDLPSSDRNLAYATIDPRNNLLKDNDRAKAMRDAWDKYAANGKPKMDDYTFNHPSQNDIVPADRSIEALYYVDEYYDADEAEMVTEVFDSIVSSILISAAEVPTEIKGNDPVNDGYITYTDPLGEYTRVKDVKAILYAGNVYTQKSVTPTDESRPTTYVFEGEVHSPVYGEQNINDIIITVTADNKGNETIVIKVPASVIPVRVNTVVLNADGTVDTHTNNGAYPVRVIYSVSVSDTVLKTVDGEQVVDVSEVSADYIAKNTNADGSVNFYSNLYTGTNVVNGSTAGDTTVEFEPSHTNPFYYIQSDMPIYDKDGKQVSADVELDDDVTYYYKITYYHGTEVVNKDLARTGAQLKKTEVIKKDGYWYRAAGSPRLNRILEFEGTKSNNVTNTAEDFYAPTFKHADGSTNPYDGKYVIYLGNNGVVTKKVGGHLAISKTVTAADGLTAPRDAEFEFTINFSGNDKLEGTFEYEVVNGSDAVTSSGSISDGGTITLKDGETATIKNLPPNTTYTVTEAKTTGFVTTVNNTETNKATGKIQAGVISTAAFMNRYEVDKVVFSTNGELTGKKVLKGRDWDNDDSFKFFITPYNNAPLPEEYNETTGVTVTKAEKVGENYEAEFDFGSITFDKPGVYRYTIVEKEPENNEYLPGMIYSRALYRVVVTVEDNGNGKLVVTNSDIQKLYTDDAVALFTYDNMNNIKMNEGQEAEDAIIFTNIYSAEDVVRTPVALKSYIDNSGSKPLVSGMFKFELKPIGIVNGNQVDTSAVTSVPMPIDNEGNRMEVVITENEGHNVTFNSVTFKQSDIPQGKDKITFRYQMSEVLPEGANVENGYTVDGMKYDPTVYNIDVTLSLDANSEVLIVNAVYPDGVRIVTFNNEYTPEPVKANIQGQKTLNGRDMLEGETFTFNLTPSASTGLAAVNGAIDVSKSETSVSVSGGKNGQVESFDFGELTFNKAGSYVFFVNEEVGNADGVLYDEHVAEVTITVTDVNGKLQAEVVYSDSEEGVVFENVYMPVFDDSTAIDLVGKKELTGRRLKAGEFYFTVEELDENGNVVSSKLVSNDVQGEIKFLESVSYAKAGTYVYRISEQIPDPGVKGMTYDTTKYIVTVTVKDELDGSLKAYFEDEWLKEEATGKSVSEIKFDNEYVPEKETVVIHTMHKAISGDRNKALEANEFLFEMSLVSAEDADGILLPGETTADHLKELEERTVQVGNNADGTIEFGSLTFLKAGTYTVAMKEVIPAEEDQVAGMIYSTEEKIITYNVTDDLAGNLTVTSSSSAGTHTFTNVYETSGQMDLTIVKEFTGRENDEWLEDDAFTFEVVVLDPATQQAIQDGKVVFPVDGDDHIQVLEINAADADKRVTSPAITFNAAGTYRFVVREIAGTIPGVNYDSKAHEIVVTASDNGEGALALSWDDLATESTQDQQIVFTNVYDAKSTELSGHQELKITKEFTGRENNEWLESDSFIFKLTYGDDVTEEAIAAGTVELPADELVVTNANKAYPHFGNIIFHEAGTFKFAITEVAPEDAVTNQDGSKTYQGINYDVTPRTIVVEVVDNEVGGLVATRIDADPLTFINTYSLNEVVIEGKEKLKISKTLERRDWFESDAFSFELYANNSETAAAVEVGDVILPESVTITLQKNGVEKTVAGAFGDIVFKKAGTFEFAIREVIPEVGIAGITYDTHTARVVVTVVDNEKGQLVASSVNFINEKEFINYYTADAIQVVLSGHKQLTGKMLQSGVFSFHIAPVSSTLKDANGKDIIPMPATQTVTNGDGNDYSKVSFGAISFDKPGTYVYEITEAVGSAPGITYDTEKVTATVTVTNNEKIGTLEATVSYVKGQNDPSTSFTFGNVYTTTKTEPVSISAKKSVVGLDGNVYTMSGGEFKFEIVPSQNNPASDPVAKGQVVNTADGTIALLSQVEYTEAGVYRYTVSEIGGTVGGIIYDDVVYTIEVVVEDNQEIAQLEAVTTIKRMAAGAEPVVADSIQFTNQYKPDNASALIYGQKNLLGNHKKLESGEFQFVLEAVSGVVYDAEGNEQAATVIPMPQGSENVAANADTGLFQFGTISYDRPGVYTYKISEVQGSKPGYTYSDATYQVTVTVTDNQGVLTAQVSGLQQVVFNNSYVPKSAFATIGGTKVLDGRDPKDGEFTFELLDAEGNGVRETTNVGNNFTFNAIEYTKAGVYHYTLVEKDTKVDGVTYDNTVYSVKVTVTDPDYAGQLHVAVEYIKDDTTVETATFNNLYKAAPTSMEFAAVKAMFGRPLNEDEFTFVLVDENEKETTATNAADGSIDFGEIQYEAAGTYTYTIFEQIPEQKAAGVSYDERVYTVVVTVKDELNGHLSVTNVEYSVANGEFEDAEDPAVVFTNKYVPEAVSVSIGGLKELVGRELFDEEFEFALIDMDGQEMTAKNREQYFKFDDVTFDEVGTYYFKIVEKDTNVAGVTYNPENVIYDVKVEVTDEGYTGKLAATVSYFKDDQVVDVSNIVFTNVYRAKPVSIEVNAVKQLVGRTMQEGEFKFVLEDAQGNKLYAVNAADGSIRFDTISYDTAGTYIYKLYEEKGNLEHVTYDETVYTFVITVTDDLKGNLNAEVKCDSESFIFNNKYEEPVVEKPEIKDDSNVDSGDHSNTVSYAVASLTAMVALIVLIICKRKSAN